MRYRVVNLNINDFTYIRTVRKFVWLNVSSRGTKVL